jgi:hypothetical protein
MLERASQQTGRSLSQEIEFRLEQSLRDDAARIQFYGRPEVDALLKQIAGVIAIVEQKTGRRWTEDYETFLAMDAALKQILKWVRDTMMPKPSAHSVRIVREVFETMPKIPKVPLPAAAPTTFGELFNSRFGSDEDAKRAREKLEDWVARAEEASKYFARFQQIGVEAASEATAETRKTGE